PSRNSSPPLTWPWLPRPYRRRQRRTVRPRGCNEDHRPGAARLPRSECGSWREHRRQLDGECAPLPCSGALDEDVAFVPPDGGTDDEQSEPGAFYSRRGARNSVEPLEDALLVGIRDADAVIANAQLNGGFVGLIELNVHLYMTSGIFDGVVQQVRDDG